MVGIEGPGKKARLSSFTFTSESRRWASSGLCGLFMAHSQLCLALKFQVLKFWLRTMIFEVFPTEMHDFHGNIFFMDSWDFFEIFVIHCWAHWSNFFLLLVFFNELKACWWPRLMGFGGSLLESLRPWFYNWKEKTENLAVHDRENYVTNLTFRQIVTKFDWMWQNYL